MIGVQFLALLTSLPHAGPPKKQAQKKNPVFHLPIHADSFRSLPRLVNLGPT